MVVDLATDPQGLNDALKANRSAIDQLGTTDPELWNEIKNHNHPG